METDTRRKQRNIILNALMQGERLTTESGNRLAGTVDFRKYISILRAEGKRIKDVWQEGPDGRRFKIYFMTNL